MRLYLLLLSGIFIFLGCDKYDTLQTPPYEAEFAIPIIEQASIRFPELWQNNDPNQSLVVEPNGRIVYKYQGPKAVIETLDLLPTLTVILLETVPEGTNKVPISSSIPIDLIIEEAQIIGGEFRFTFDANGVPSETTKVTFTVPEITKDGEPLVIETNTLTNRTPPVDLTGFVIRPVDNQLTINYTAFNRTGVPITLSNITLASTPQVQVLKGFLGRQIETIAPDIIPINLYDERFLNGSIQFAEPRISAFMENTFGVPVRSQIDILNAYRLEDSIGVPIQYDAIDDVAINYPSVEEIGDKKFTELYLDHNNSNIVEVFNEGVSGIEYGLSVVMNPDNDSTITSFVTDTSFFSVEVLVEVPMIVSSSNFVATDTYGFTPGEIDNIQEGEFKLIVENELPLAADFQLYFVNINGRIIDSLFQDVPTLVEGAPVDESGNVIGVSETTSFIPISAGQIQRIQEAQFLETKTFFRTSGAVNQPVEILDSQALRFRLGLRFTL